MTPKNKSEFREWKIGLGWRTGPSLSDEIVHVIEKKAFTELLSDFNKAVAALEQYQDYCVIEKFKEKDSDYYELKEVWRARKVISSLKGKWPNEK